MGEPLLYKPSLEDGGREKIRQYMMRGGNICHCQRTRQPTTGASNAAWVKSPDHFRLPGAYTRNAAKRGLFASEDVTLEWVNEITLEA